MGTFRRSHFGQVLLSQTLSSLSSFNHSQVTTSVWRLAIICTPNQSHPLFLSQLPIHASLFLATPLLQLVDFAFRKLVDRCARVCEMANSVSDHDLPDVYRLPGIESLLCNGQCLGAEDARDSQTGEAK
jgi:hypothetical protein